MAVALRFGQLDHVVQERQHELVNRGEAEADLGLDTGDARDGEVARVGHRVLEQGGLADPGSAPQDDDAARAVERPARSWSMAVHSAVRPTNTAEP
jgi:hypothetical protein